MKWLNEEVDLEERDGSRMTVTRSTWKDAFMSFKAKHQGEAPDRVKPVGRLLADLKALSTIVEPEVSIHRLVQGSIWIHLGNRQGCVAISIWLVGRRYGR